MFGGKDRPDADRIMHGMLETDAGYTIMAADITSAMKHHPMAGFSVSLSGAGDGRSLPGSATREGNRCAARGLEVRGGTAVIGVPAGESACAEPEAEAR